MREPHGAGAHHRVHRPNPAASTRWKSSALNRDAARPSLPSYPGPQRLGTGCLLFTRPALRGFPGEERSGCLAIRAAGIAEGELGDSRRRRLETESSALRTTRTWVPGSAAQAAGRQLPEPAVRREPASSTPTRLRGARKGLLGLTCRISPRSSLFLQSRLVTPECAGDKMESDRQQGTRLDGWEVRADAHRRPAAEVEPAVGDAPPTTGRGATEDHESLRHWLDPLNAFGKKQSQARQSLLTRSFGFLRSPLLGRGIRRPSGRAR